MKKPEARGVPAVGAVDDKAQIWREVPPRVAWYGRKPVIYAILPLLAVVVIAEMFLVFFPFMLSGGWQRRDRDNNLRPNFRWPRTRLVDALHATAGGLPLLGLACWGFGSGLELILLLLLLYPVCTFGIMVLRDSIPGAWRARMALPSGGCVELKQDLLLGGCLDIHTIEIAKVDARGIRSRPAVFGNYMEFFHRFWIGEAHDSSIVIISELDGSRSRDRARPRMIEWVAHRVAFDAEGNAVIGPATPFATVSESDYCWKPRSTHEVSRIENLRSGPWLLDAQILVEHLREMPSARIYAEPEKV